MGVSIRMHSVWASRLEWAGTARGGHHHSCCSSVGPGKCVMCHVPCVMVLIVVLGSIVSGSVLR